MSKPQLTRYAIMLVLLILSFTFATPTFACFSPTIRPLEERLDRAPIVLVGTVVEMIPLHSFYYIARVEVETYLQGTGPAVVEIFPLTDNVDFPCSYYPPMLGIRAMFFAHEHDNTRLQDYTQLHGISYSGNALLVAHSQSNSVIYASDDIIAEARSYLNNPLRLFYRLARQLERWTQPYYLLDMLPLLGLGLAGALGIVFIVKRRRYNRQKPKRG